MPEQIDLSDVLVLVAALDSLAGGTSASLSNLAVAGATIQYGSCYAEVSLTRNLQAYFAEKSLRENDGLQWVLWLDHDVMIMADGVLHLRELARCVQGSVSALYLNRHQDKPIAAAEYVRGQPARKVEYDWGEVSVLLPALTGLGAFMQSRESFLQHCDESERFAFHNYRQEVPAVCMSAIFDASVVGKYTRTVGDRCWVNEDFDYCIREFEHGRPVYLSSVQCKHRTTTWLVPPAEVVVPGYHAEMIDNAT